MIYPHIDFKEADHSAHARIDQETAYATAVKRLGELEAADLQLSGWLHVPRLRAFPFSAVHGPLRAADPEK